MSALPADVSSMSAASKIACPYFMGGTYVLLNAMISVSECIGAPGVAARYLFRSRFWPYIRTVEQSAGGGKLTQVPS